MAIRSATSKIMRPRRASPARMVVARCQASSVRRWGGVRRIVRAVVRPRGIAKTSLSEAYASFFCHRIVDPLARGSKRRAKPRRTPPPWGSRATQRGARLCPGAQCVRGTAVRGGEARYGRRRQQQGSALTVVHEGLFLSLISHKESLADAGSL